MLLTMTDTLVLLPLVVTVAYFVVAFLMGGVDLAMVRFDLNRGRAGESSAEAIDGEP